MYQRYEKLPHEKDEEDVDCGCIELMDMTRHDEAGKCNRNPTKVFIDEWKESAREVSTSLLKMVKVLERAPGNVRNFDSFKIICDTTRKAMGLREDGEEQMIENRDTMTQVMKNDEIDDPEWIDIMIELTKAAEKTYILKNRNEFPTFTLILEWDNSPSDRAENIPQFEKQNLNQEKKMETEQEKELEKEPVQEPEQDKEQERENEAGKVAEKENEPEKEQARENEKVPEKEGREEEYQVTFKNDIFSG